VSSARRLVEGAGSLWGEIAPLLPSYVRRVNLGEYDRIFPPHPSTVDPKRQFIVNDAGFDIAANYLRGRTSDPRTMLSNVASKWRSRFKDTAVIEEFFSAEEIQDTIIIANRLVTILEDRKLLITNYNITLPGLGRLENVEIDVYGNSLIGEVKAGYRPFRSIDFRQILLACVVHGVDCADHNIFLINPREGIEWRCRASDFVQAISLMPFSEFINEFRYVLSEVGIST
jgi:hypothetical protein